MPVVLYELADSRPVDQSTESASVTRKWIANGSSDESAVANALLLLAPRRWRNLPRTRYTVEPIGGSVWMCSVEYTFNANTDDPDQTQEDTNDDTQLGPESSFDLSGGTAHITQSLATLRRWRPGKQSDTPAGDAIAFGINAQLTQYLYTPLSTQLTLDGYAHAGGNVGKMLYLSGPGFTMGRYQIVAGAGATVTVGGRAGPRQGATGGAWVIADEANIGTATDLKQAIGGTTDGVTGTDIVIPKFEFTWGQQVFPVTLPYLRRLRSIVGKTNNAKWRGFDRGELLYLGASGSPSPGNVWRVAHKFACGENLYGVRVSTDIVIPQKRAWEHLWCPYGYSADQTVLPMVPLAAYVEQVYAEADFTQIGLGR